MASKLGAYFRDDTMPGHQPVPALSVPKTVAFEEPPAPSVPAKVLFQPSLALSSPDTIQPQQPPALTSPAAPITQDPPQLLTPEAPGFQQPPAALMPTAPGTQDPPALTVPTAPVSQDPPTLLSPTAPGTQDPPTLVVPDMIAMEPAPDLLRPTPPGTEPPPALLQPSAPGTEPPPALLVPGQMPTEPPPSLLSPAAIGTEAPPALLQPIPPTTQAPPALLMPVSGAFEPPPGPAIPAPVPFEPPPGLLKPDEIKDIGGKDFYQPEAAAFPWEMMADQQLNYMLSTVPQTLMSMAQRVMPNPGGIDTELLPSTQVAKALNVANEAIRNVENQYGYEPASNAGNRLATALGSAMGVNYAPEGSYEYGDNGQRIELINRDARTGQLSSLWQNKAAGILASRYRGPMTDDTQRDALSLSLVQARPYYDDGQGLLDDSVTVTDASKAVFTTMPFYLVDLRPDSGKKYRTCFFTPINLEIGETFSPNWNVQNFLGRVDPVATYQNTLRTLNISFKLVAIDPGDVGSIYKKLGWLSSLTYPEYSPNMRYKSGPVAKLRIGNVINSSSPSIPLSDERPGVPGFITSLDLKYDNVWELDDGWQLPRGVDVSFSFTVLHELPVGVLDGVFGTVGSLDSNGIFTTPQQSMDDANKNYRPDSKVAASDYSDPDGFRKFGKYDSDGNIVG